jgi:hypothetical protein
MSIQTYHTVLLLPRLVFFFLLGLGAWAQASETSSSALVDEKELGEVAFLEPAAVGEELDDDALRFYLLSARPVRQRLYFMDGEDYKQIQVAYNTFGSMHRISPRQKFVLYAKTNQLVGNEEQPVYTPIYEVNVAGRSEVFAVFLPMVSPREGEVSVMNAIDFSTETFPYGKVTFLNILPRPLLVLLGEERAVVPPGQILRADYEIRRKGAGSLNMALGIHDVDGSAKLLYRQHLGVYEGERTIAVPIVHPLGGDELNVLIFREDRRN